MSTIIAISNSGGKGKSSTLLELANLLITIPGSKVLFCSHPITSIRIDFRLVIEIRGKIVVLESQGDPGTDLEKRLDNIFSTYKPKLVFCTCRTKGETVWAINAIASKYSFDEIWTSTYETTHSHSHVNKLKAEHLLDLSIKLGLI